MGKALEINDGNFEQVVTQTDSLVFVDFWGNGCPPCDRMAPIVEKFAGEYEGQIVVGKCNVNMNMQTAMKFGIMSIPTFIFFRGGKAIDKHIGYIPESKLKQVFDKHLELV